VAKIRAFHSNMDQTRAFHGLCHVHEGNNIFGSMNVKYKEHRFLATNIHAKHYLLDQDRQREVSETVSWPGNDKRTLGRALNFIFEKLRCPNEEIEDNKRSRYVTSREVFFFYPLYLSAEYP